MNRDKVERNRHHPKMKPLCTCDTTNPQSLRGERDQTLLNETSLLSANINPDDRFSDPLFWVCWRRQSCGWCLQGDVACSWCALSSTCVPNRSSFPILAPVRSTDVCPLGQKERWELRAVPFGCNISTLTLLTGVCSIVGTLVVLGVGCLAVRSWMWAWAWGRAKWGVDKFGNSDTDRNGSWVARMRSGTLRRRSARTARVLGDIEGRGGGDRGEISDGESERRPLLDRG